MQYRSLNDSPVNIRVDGGRKIISGRAAVFNSLSCDLGGYREKINPKAFDRTLREIKAGKRHCSARLQHASGLCTIGTTMNSSLELWTDALGLNYDIVALPDTQAGRDAETLIEGGYINKSSFAFRIPDRANGLRWDHTTNPPTVELLDVDLVDVAPVDGPAYEATSVQARSEALAHLRDTTPRVEINVLDEIVSTWRSRHMADTISSGKVIEALAAVPDAQSIEVYINSPGGDVYESMAIYNTLKAHPAPVNVHVLGLAASGASIIAMAGDTINMGTGSFVMIHNAWTDVAGNAGQLRDAATFLDQIDGELASVYTKRTGIDSKQVRDMMNAETWMNSEQAVAQGFATGVSGESAPIDGERCAAMGYRNIPREISAPGDIQFRREMTPNDITELVAKELQKTRAL